MSYNPVAKHMHKTNRPSRELNKYREYKIQGDKGDKNGENRFAMSRTNDLRRGAW